MLKFGQEAKDWGIDHYETKEHIEELRNIVTRVDMTDPKTREWAALCDRTQEAFFPHVGALCRFLQRPWFRRIWIVQEFSLGREVVFVCGHKRADSDILYKGIRISILSAQTNVSARMWGWVMSDHI